MGLPKIGGHSWQDDIIAAHEAYFQNGIISVYDPSHQVGGRPVVVIDRRPARIQHQRTPQIATDSGQQIAKRAYLFEFTPQAGDGPVEKDMLVRVHDGGRDEQLELYGFTVTNSTNSSEMALRYIEALTELAILPRIP